MSGIKKLAGQTLWYGVPTIASRFLGYLMNLTLPLIFAQPSKTADLTFDDNKISEDNLLPAPAFELALAQSPLHYLFIPVPNLQAFKLKNSSLLLKYGPKGQPSAMEVKINFEDNQEQRVACADAVVGTPGGIRL